MTGDFRPLFAIIRNCRITCHRSIFWGSGGPVSSAVIRGWCVPFRASLVRAGSREEERGRRVSGQRPVSAPPLLERSPGPGGRQQPGGWAGPGWREPVPEVGGCDATPLPLGGAPFLLLRAVSPQRPLSSPADDRGSWADREGLRVEGREPGPVAAEWPVLRPRGCEGPGGPWWACPFVGMAGPLGGALGFDGFLTPRRIQKHVSFWCLNTVWGRLSFPESVSLLQRVESRQPLSQVG